MGTGRLAGRMLIALVVSLVAVAVVGPAAAVTKGDLNKDGTVGIADAVVALRLAVGLMPTTPELISIGDVAPLPQGDNKIGLDDVTRILRFAVGLLSADEFFPTQPPAPKTLFLSDFTKDTLDQYEIIDAQDSSGGPSAWSVRDGALVNDSNIYGNPDPPDGLENPYTGTMAVVKGVSGADCTFTVTCTPKDDDGLGVLFRYQDEGNFYRVLSIVDGGNGGPITRLDKWENGSFTVLASTTDKVYTPNASNVIRICGIGSTLNVYLNDTTTPILTASDRTYTSGRVGVSLYALAPVAFTRLELVEGEAPPLAVKSVSVTPAQAQVPTGQSVSFTASVDASEGLDKSVVWSVDGGAASGTISPNGVYTAPLVVPANPTVTVRATSKADPSKSATAQVTITQGTSARVIFASDFSKDTLDQYDILDAPDSSGGPSNWIVQDGALQQTTNIYGLPDPVDGLANPYTGTMAIAKGVSAGDCVVTMEFTPDDNDGIGLIGRYVDEGTFYRLESEVDPGNGGPITRLEVWKDGEFTVLASTTQVTYTPNVPNTFRLVFRGNQISAYVNDLSKPLLTAEDNTVQKGSVGVSLYATNAIRIANLMVTE